MQLCVPLFILVISTVLAEDCGDNQTYKECNGCDGTCDYQYPMCDDTCVAGCYCNEGYVRDENNECIPLTSCGNCGENESYKDGETTCGGCNATCRYPDIICPQVCRVGCFCDDDYVRNKDNLCILTNQCSDTDCKENETFRDGEATCGTICEATCNDPNPSCWDICIPGCFCKEGYVRDGGECILPSSCSMTV